jgi:hypothetical protein
MSGQRGNLPPAPPTVLGQEFEELTLPLDIEAVQKEPEVYPWRQNQYDMIMFALPWMRSEALRRLKENALAEKRLVEGYIRDGIIRKPGDIDG